MSRTASRLVMGVAVVLIVCAASASANTVTIKSGTKLMLDLSTPLNSATARIDDEVWFTVRDDIRVDGVKALPRGTPVRGSVTSVRPAIVNGKNQRAEIQIRLEQIPLAEGGGFTISTPDVKVQAEKAIGVSNTAQNTIGQATQGALLGGLITRSAKGAGIGAAAGVAIGVLSGTLASKGPSSDVDLPSGSVFETRLGQALEIQDPKTLAKAIPAKPAPTTPDAPAATSTPVVDTAVVVPAPDSSIPVPDATRPRDVPTFDPLGTGEASNSTTSAAPGPETTVTTDSTAGQPTPGGTATLRVDVNLIQVDAVVRDRAGKPLNNLRQDDFRIFEDGVEQHIQFFSRDQQPLAVALVIDRSGSVAPLMSQVQTAAFQALQLLKAGDQVALFSFASNVEMLEELTSNRQRVANRIGSITAGGGTAIVDAVSEALRYLDTTAPDRRRAVILISDNVEGRSSVSATSAISFALESEAVVYSVKVGAGAGLLGIPGIPGIPAPRFPGQGGDPVKVITRETGGEIFDATGGSSIAAALSSAVDRLKTRYTLSYAATPSAARSAKGGYHRIEVQLVSRFGRPDIDYTVHARSGYYDAPARTAKAASH